MFALLLLVGAVFSTQAEAADLRLIPSPQEVRELEGVFVVPERIVIAIGDGEQEAQLLPARQLKEDLERTGINAEVAEAEGGAGARILLGLQKDTAIQAALEAKGIEVPDRIGGEGYVLQVTADGAVVAAKQAAGLYYGVQTLRQLIVTDDDSVSIPAVEIIDWPAMPFRGIHRGLTNRDDIERLAHLKMNLMVWEVNDRPEYEKHPELGGTVALEDIRSIADFCARHHIMLVLQTQSFGHAHWALRHHPELRAFPDNTHNFRPLYEPTYEFLDDIYSELCPLYPAPYYFPGCDEPWRIERWATEHDLEPADVVGKHIARLAEIAARHGKPQIMVWGDYLLRYPQALDHLSPENVIICDWHYNPISEYPTVDIFRERGFEVLACPAVIPARPVFMDYDRQLRNIRNFVVDAYKRGAAGLLNTNWPVDPIPTEAYWYGWATGAEFAWAPDKRSQEQFDAAFFPRFYDCRGDNARKLLRVLADLAPLKERANTGAGSVDDVVTRVLPQVTPVQEGQITTQYDAELEKAAAGCVEEAEKRGRKRLSTIIDYGRGVVYPAMRADLLLKALAYVTVAERTQEDAPARAASALSRARESLSELNGLAADRSDADTVDFCTHAMEQMTLPVSLADVLRQEVDVPEESASIVSPGNCFESIAAADSEIAPPQSRRRGELVFPNRGGRAIVNIRVFEPGEYRVFALMRHSCGAWKDGVFDHGTRNAVYEGKYDIRFDTEQIEENWIGDELNPEADEAMQWASLGKWDLAAGHQRIEVASSPEGPNWAIIEAFVFTQDPEYDPTVDASEINARFTEGDGGG